MHGTQKIRTVIVDDNKEFLESLKDHFIKFPDIELCGHATHYRQARELLLNEKPDLVFLDIEMPCKNGFELLNEVREKGCTSSVIFCTAYDKYMIQALREAAFDYILKPVDPEELRLAINRFIEQRAVRSLTSTTPVLPAKTSLSEIIALPTVLGLRFIDKNTILLFRSTHETLLSKSSWEVMLTDSTAIKIGAHTTAERIMQLLSKDRFMQINQSCILNLSWMHTLEFKTHRCLLLPPFDTLELFVSRAQLSKLKEVLEVL